MPWETPSFIEIRMSSEIGGYQEDFDQRAPTDPTATGLPAEQSGAQAYLPDPTAVPPPCG